MATHVSLLGIQNTLREPQAINKYYMLLPIEQGFNWTECFALVDRGEWYLVVFRSKHRHNADEDYLNLLDARASAAASQTPGFLFYFIGEPLPSGECLSFCLWEDRASAQLGGAHPAHRRAVEEGIGAFEYYNLERYFIRKQTGHLMFAPVRTT